MEEMTGIQLLKSIKPNCSVIITSAYSEYAIDGFDLQVCDYLLKPYSFDRFIQAIQKVRALDKTSNLQETIEEKDFIYIKGDAKNKYHRIKFSEIIFIEGLKNYIRFHCKNSKVITLMNLKDLESILPKKQFCRVHRSFIINTSFIQCTEGNRVKLDERHIPLGEGYKKQFLSTIREDLDIK